MEAKPGTNCIGKSTSANQSEDELDAQSDKENIDQEMVTPPAIWPPISPTLSKSSCSPWSEKSSSSLSPIEFHSAESGDSTITLSSGEEMESNPSSDEESEKHAVEFSPMESSMASSDSVEVMQQEEEQNMDKVLQSNFPFSTKIRQIVLSHNQTYCAKWV